MSATLPLEVALTTRGDVEEADREYAREKVQRACRPVRRPVLAARATLVREPGAALERPCVAKASVDVGGRVVRAQVAARTFREAIDLLEPRLRRAIDALAERDARRRQGAAPPEPGTWRHGATPTPRPEYFPRPPEERRVVRRKTFASAPVAPADAAWEMELLDHDFHLFADATTGGDAVVFRRDDGTLGLDESPAPSLRLDEAIALLDAGDVPFVFFRDAGSQRAHVVYRRYNGHYGLVVPADEL